MSDKIPTLVVVGSDGSHVHRSGGCAKPAGRTGDDDPRAVMATASTEAEKAFSDLMTIMGLSTAVWSAGLSVAWATWLCPLNSKRSV